jgi:uroporphyrinogen-III synthase
MAKTDKKPLAGRTVAITRPADSSEPLRRKLEEAGAAVLEIPLIRTVRDSREGDIAEMFEDLWSYEWILFTSASGVRFFFEHFFEKFEDIRSLGNAHIAVIGQGTEAELKKLHLKADLTPKTATGEALAEALIAEQSLDNLNLLVITGNLNSDALPKKLEAERAIVDCVQVYRTEDCDISAHEGAALFREKGADAIVFASGSAVASFAAQAVHFKTSPNAVRPAACSIGPATSEAMKKAGLPVDAEAAEASPEAIVAALTKFFSKKAAR